MSNEAEQTISLSNFLCNSTSDTIYYETFYCSFLKLINSYSNNNYSAIIFSSSRSERLLGRALVGDNGNRGHFSCRVAFGFTCILEGRQ